ncbi:hypothetical protein QV13_12440 [Mesorhizobium hungaricum]|uniref:PIN domain-containing protein n=2 Tax=Hyphomicrobiales TaxID=356 RepID=A0A1C2DS03_9HYPH|nr:hypothetical protein QV13_12440 [Mesorhizobium hungaricum]
MQELARVITTELAKSNHKLRVFVWGWNTLEEKINEDADARNSFDPTYDPFSGKLLDETRAMLVAQHETRADMSAGFSRIEAMITEVSALRVVPPGDTTVAMSLLEEHLDAEIDEYRELNNNGKTLTALPLLERLLDRVKTSASGRILFRIKANIGHCLVALGKDDDAAAMLLASYSHAPDEPKAVANKAFGHLLREEYEEVLAFGSSMLEANPTNEWLAGYVVQAARFDTSISDPLGIVPEQLHATASVQIGRIDFVRRNGKPGDWWPIARKVFEAHPLEPYAMQFAAEADLEEILASEGFQNRRLLSPTERSRLEAAATILISRWDHARVADGAIRPEDAAVCCNILVTLHALGNLNAAIDIAHQGLSLAPNDVEIITRAAVVAIDADDELFARSLLAKLPRSSDAAVLKFRFHAARGDWEEVVRIAEDDALLIPASEAPAILTTGKLAKIKISHGDQETLRQQISSIASEASGDARASIIVADFARREGIQGIADDTYKVALTHISDESHVADRLMVAHHAARRGDYSIVVDLLDNHVAEDHDNDELRTLARALVNDYPIRQRALAFFERLSVELRALPFFLNAEGLLHFNRGALSEAEAALRKAVQVRPDLENYLALISVLYRSDRNDELKEVVEAIDLKTVDGTPGQKMFLAQIVRKIGEGAKALEYAYEVLRSARNDQNAALRYFGLIMMNPADGLIPPVETVAVGTWVSLESDKHETHAFLIEEGSDRPAEDILSPAHPTVAAALGLKINDEFEMPAGFGRVRKWRVVEIKHKYLHALHDVMENFEKRFPDTKGFYKVTIEDDNIQPALDQVRRVSESNRKLADLYLENNYPISLVVSRGDRDAISFVDYIRFLDFDIRTCAGTEAERVAAEKILSDYRHTGAVLDTYTAWTVATMDAFAALKSVVGSVIVPQSVIDELRTLRDDQEFVGQEAMTIAWHDGEYIKQEFTAGDVAVRRNYIIEKIARIEAACDIRPVIIENKPSELAILTHQSLGAHVLDAANLAGTKHILLSEDMNFRQFGEAACSTRGVWLQAVFAFARALGTIDQRDYVDLVVKLAWHRHGHLSLDAATLLVAYEDSRERNLENFKALAHFMGTKNADMRSHINVAVEFLNQLWLVSDQFDVACQQATGVLLEQMIRYHSTHWALVLTLIKRECAAPIQQYIGRWLVGHFLPTEDVSRAEIQIEERMKQLSVSQANRGI